MPKNKGKGGKNRKRGKNENEEEKRELVYKEDGQEYAQVVRMLGNGRLEAQCIDGKKRLCHIRGKMRKKVWVAQGDIVLVGLRDYQDEKADVIMKYTADEARVLKTYGELPENIRINDTDVIFEGEDKENQEVRHMLLCMHACKPGSCALSFQQHVHVAACVPVCNMHGCKLVEQHAPIVAYLKCIHGWELWYHTDRCRCVQHMCAKDLSYTIINISLPAVLRFR